MTSFPRCDATAAWAALRGHFEAHGRDLDLREAFARDPARFERFGVEAPDVFCDLSKNRIDAATLHFLADLARECGVEAWRDAMLAGEAINTTEGRAVLHTALRAPPGTAPFSDEVHATPRGDARFRRSRAGAGRGRGAAASPRRQHRHWRQRPRPADGGRGAGSFAHPQLELHFVSNVDGHDIASVLRRIAPAETLFIVASKTFTTQETMANAGDREGLVVSKAAAARWPSIRRRDDQRGSGGALRHHPHLRLSRLGRRPLLALVGDRPADRDRRRRRGLSRAARGRRAMDEHFARRRVEKNLPMLLGLVDVWYRNFHGFASRSVPRIATA